MNEEIEIEYYPKLKDSHLEESIRLINERKEKWDNPFFFDTKSYIELDKIKKVVDPLISVPIHNIVVLGTGGSIQTFLALKHLSKKKIFPITSSRAVELKSCLENTKPEDTIVIPISRAGETLDINSTIGTFAKRGYQFLGLSSTGTMNQILTKLKCPILEVPDLTGRFAASISNVAIVPAYLADIDVNLFIKGLETTYNNILNRDTNFVHKFSALIYALYNKGYRVLFSMPYSINLEGSVGLFVQEISESTGKDGKGLMGTYQSAPLCQHSVLEYLLGGMKGIVLPIIWTVKNELVDISLNSTLQYIDNQTAQTIINYQADATFQALLEQTVPGAKISLETPNAYNIGKLIAFIQGSVYFLCLLLDVNWANNPKVNIGKKICNKALLNKLSSQERKSIRKSVADVSFTDFI
ncbi:MAG: hypothetical protein ACFE8E_12035 [Candidatus Hodarchaeota archaeon]